MSKSQLDHPGDTIHVWMDGSDLFVTYRIYKDGSPTDMAVYGNGDSISLGYITAIGVYGVMANGTKWMRGKLFVSLKPIE